MGGHVCDRSRRSPSRGGAAPSGPQPASVLKGAALRTRRRRIEWTRRVVQGAFLVVVLLIGYEFVRWVRALEVGDLAERRPPGVEGFLPIAALLSLRHLLSTAEVHPVHPAALVILLLVLLTSLLAKKAFCSWVCPVGALQEGLASLSRRLFRRKLRLPALVDRPLRSLKYLLFAFFGYAVFFQMGEGAVRDFLDSPYNRVADVKMLYFFERLSLFGATVLGALALLSFLVPYFWCRYLCPYGALLGAVSLLSPLKITRHAPSCIDCGLCSKACPSHLPVERLARVRSDECFACLSCIAACPVPRALRIETPAPWRRAVRPAVFASLVAGVFVAGTWIARASGHWRNAVSNQEYARRIRTIDSPAYAHDRGRVPARAEWGPLDAR